MRQLPLRARSDLIMVEVRFLQFVLFFFFSSRRRHTRCSRDWSSDVCSSDLLSETGVLEKYKVEMIGASLRAIKVAEDRLWFKDACRKIGLEVPASALVNNAKDALRLCDQLGFPLVIRPSFTLGGTGGSIAHNKEEFGEAIAHALDMSPVHEALVEESVLGWKEYELEVMRDFRDNFVVICTIENFDPMGVHTGDSITVAPAQTLTDKEFQRMRDASAAIIREVGVETGG